MEEALCLNPKSAFLYFGNWLTKSKFDQSSSRWFVDHDSRLVKHSLRIRYALGKDIELRGELTSAELRADSDVIVYRRSGVNLLRDTNLNARLLTDFLLGAKFNLYQKGTTDDLTSVSLALDVKIPLPDREDDYVTTGGVDVAAGMLVTWHMGRVALHANLGAAYFGDESMFEQEVDMDITYYWGFAAVWELLPELHLIGQLQGHGRAFDIDVLDEHYLSVAAGVRYNLVSTLFLELGGGVGLTEDTYDYQVSVSVQYGF
jgi:hypothetical protein